MVNATMPHLTLHQTPSPNIHTSIYDTMQKYLTLISTDQLIQVLLQCDRHNQVVDKWLLAIVFEYFQRSKLLHYQFTREKFFIALYLAIEFEEDEDRKVKDVLLDYMLHHDNIWTSKRQFIKKKDKYWKKLGFRCMVTRERLEQIIAIDPYHAVWQRVRKETMAGANRSFACKLDPPSFYKFQWSMQPTQQQPQHQQPSHPHHHQAPVSREIIPRKVPEVIDLTKDSPPVPIKPHERKRTSAAYRHLHSIVTLIERDRGRRRPPQDILKMKHAQQKRFNELQMLETLARTNSFTALNNELAHLNVNHTLSSTQSCINQLQYANYPLLYNTDVNDFSLPGLILLPDRRMSFPMFNLDHLAGNGGIPSPNLPMVIPVVPRTDHWV
ncbi:hypothetical protein ACHWQZ_G001310 [Mnemiopsis leidyi]